MGILDKLQTIIILFAVGLGFLLGQVNIIEQYAKTLVIPFLFLMLYGLFLTIPLQQLKRAFLNIQFLGANTIINFIWTPVMAWGLGSIFLRNFQKENKRKRRITTVFSCFLFSTVWLLFFQC